MPLEACMIIVDNSEYMRNGDYAPTRFGAQNEAVSLIFNAKTSSNPENTVGVMSMAGNSPQVLATLTQDFGKVLSSMKKCHIGGSAGLMTSLNVAQLALKHRENKNQRQRIVLFLASPIGGGGGGGGVGTSSSAAAAGLEDQLVKLGKKMKKNNVAIDVILFGDEGMDNEVVLGKFVEACQSGDNCHIVSIPPGPGLLSDMIASSPILASDGGAFAASAAAGGAGDGDIDMAALGGGGGGGGDGGGDFGGIDPNMDPELAMAIRMSLQEEEERQRRAAGTTTESSAASAPAAPSLSTTNAPANPPAADIPASSVSIEAPNPTEAAQPAVPPPHAVPGSTTHAQPESTESAPISTSGVLHDAGDVEMEGEDDEDDADLLAAIAMSMEGRGGNGEDKQEGDKKT
ncbi:hypothetical protein NliqN6_4697 [Naganishia liquefaciens]|uniref:VWFA domain-containing protein n=1 Tax=Naganishia liquefaciens TaxID=104408 RepID=A0A8H3TW34_9TREE|nr:hypothetical protein NliqN6_4697 [Naganishia liquefaciens]